MKDLEKEIREIEERRNRLYEENKAYLKVMEGYRNLDKTVKCRHGKAKTQTAFKQLEDSNLEIAEVICLECQQFIGFVYRSMRTESVLDTKKMPLATLEDLDKQLRETDTHLKLEQKRIRNTVKFLVYSTDKNEYTTKENLKHE